MIKNPERSKHIKPPDDPDEEEVISRKDNRDNPIDEEAQSDIIPIVEDED